MQFFFIHIKYSAVLLECILIHKINMLYSHFSHPNRLTFVFPRLSLSLSHRSSVATFLYIEYIISINRHTILLNVRMHFKLVTCWSCVSAFTTLSKWMTRKNSLNFVDISKNVYPKTKRKNNHQDRIGTFTVWWKYAKTLRFNVHVRNISTFV